MENFILGLIVFVMGDENSNYKANYKNNASYSLEKTKQKQQIFIQLYIGTL